MSSMAQQFVSTTDDKGQISIIIPDEMPEPKFTRLDMAVANMNSPNGRVDWTWLENAQEQLIRIKFSHTNNGESLPLRSTQVTFTLQMWGIFEGENVEPIDEAEVGEVTDMKAPAE